MFKYEFKLPKNHQPRKRDAKKEKALYTSRKRDAKKEKAPKHFSYVYKTLKHVQVK